MENNNLQTCWKCDGHGIFAVCSECKYTITLTGTQYHKPNCKKNDNSSISKDFKCNICNGSGKVDYVKNPPTLSAAIRSVLNLGFKAKEIYEEEVLNEKQ